MYRTCPKCGHTREPDDYVLAARCPACGLIFQKWLRQRFRPPSVATAPSEPPAALGLRWHAFREALLVPAEDGRVEWAVRCIVWALLLWLSIQMVRTGYADVVGDTAPGSYWFLHRINLVFHEAGHIVFMPLGEFMTVLGGSLFQVLVPLVVAGAFLLRHANNFGSSVALWWTGQSVSDVAVYIRDARELRLQLLGGGTGADRPGWHDWENLLSRLGLLEHERLIAATADTIGITIMGLALIWSAALLWRQHQSID